MAMVMRYWGDSGVHAEAFASLVDRDAGGIRISQLTQAAEARGWRAVPIGMDALAPMLDAGRPPIALIDAGSGRHHYVVIVGVTDAEIVLHDPARAPFVRVPRSEFLSDLSKAGGWMAVVTPPAEAARAAAGAVADAAPSPERSASESTTSPCIVQVRDAVAAATEGDVDTARMGLDAAMLACPRDAAPVRERAGLAFAQHEYALAATLAARAAVLAPDDAYTRTLLFSSRLLAGDDAGAVAAFDVTGGAPVEDVRIVGADRIPQSLLLSQLGVAPGRPMTSAAFGRARRRLAEIPGLTAGALAVSPEQSGGVAVDVAITERRAWPTAWTNLVALGARGAVARDIGFTAAPLGRGDRLDVVWRFQPHRPALGAAFTIPAPGRLPGIVELGVSRERQSFAAAPSGVLLENAEWPDDSHATIGRVRWADWVTSWLRWEAGAGIGRFDERGRSGALATALEIRDPSDRAAVLLRNEEWAGGSRFRRTVFQAAARTGPARTAPALAARVVVAGVSGGAPAVQWVGADDSPALDVSLRAHALFDDGRPDPRWLGRRTAGMSVSLEHPGWQISSARVGWTVFADAARVWQTVVTPAPMQVDVGAGLRVSAFGAGPVRFDLAMGVRDHRFRLTVGWMRAWPSWTRGGVVASGTR